MSKFNDIELALVDLIKALALSEGERAEVQVFLDAGEYGLAFETLCGILKDGSAPPIPAPFASQLKELAETMSIEPEYWSGLFD